MRLLKGVSSGGEMRNRARLSVLCVVLAMTACAQRAPRPVGPPGTPRLGWVIMHGDADNPDREFVCQSAPRTECVMPASRPDARVFGHVHFYYHSATVDTRYAGTIRVGFFNSPREIAAGIPVKARDRAGNQSVSDLVTSAPGTHTMDIDVIATATPTGQTQNLRDQVSVTVR
jgi:hypothetical protein